MARARNSAAVVVGVVVVLASMVIAPAVHSAPAPEPPAATAAATPVGTVETFPSGRDGLGGIATGPDGNLWFTALASNAIGRVTPAGVVTGFTAPSPVFPVDIVAGPDGALWFTSGANDSIGRITTAGVITTFTGVGIDRPEEITLGGDGNLWFTNLDGDSIGRITPAGVVSAFTHHDIDAPHGIATSADGTVWFASTAGDALGRVAPDGTIISYPGYDAPVHVAAAPDGAVWFTSQGSEFVSRISPAGEVSGFSVTGMLAPTHLTAGPDGALWFADGPGRIGRMTLDGWVTWSPGPAIVSIAGLAAGPDGHVWFTDTGSDAVGRVRTVGAGAPVFVHADPGNSQVTVSWAAPPEPVGPITGYEVTGTGNTSCTTTGARTCTIAGLAVGLPFVPRVFTVRALHAGGPGPWSMPSNPASPWTGSGYHAKVPTRILDSRKPALGFNGRVTAAGARSLQVTGLGGAAEVPATASAVVLNVTATDSTAESFLTVYPTGTTKPKASNVNFGTGQVIPNLVTVKVGAGGKVDIATATGATHVVADLVGYYDDGNGGGDLFNPIAPIRTLDSRTSTGGWHGKLDAKTPRQLVVREANDTVGIPPTATAIVANVTVTGGDAQSFVSLWPSGSPKPNVSNLNLLPGQTVPNLAIVKIGTGGSISFANAVGAVDVIVDVVGYFEPTVGSRFHALAPNRVLDTRSGKGLSGPQGQGQTRGLLIPGQPGTEVPQWSTGLVANVTVADGTAESFVSVFPGNTLDRPNPYSTLNFGRRQVVANLAMVGVGQFGAINLYNHLGSTALIADVVGYFAPI